MNIFSSERSNRMLLASKDSPLNSAFVVGNQCGQFKCTINYDKTKLKKGNFYATTWLIFTGPVTYGTVQRQLGRAHVVSSNVPAPACTCKGHTQL